MPSRGCITNQQRANLQSLICAIELCAICDIQALFMPISQIKEMEGSNTQIRNN